MLQHARIFPHSFLWKIPMGWPRNKSGIEELMVEILKNKNSPMSLGEIVDEIKTLSPTALAGKTPRNSLYSIIYRREKRRVDAGENPLFKTFEERREVLYLLNT